MTCSSVAIFKVMNLPRTRATPEAKHFHVNQRLRKLLTGNDTVLLPGSSVWLHDVSSRSRVTRATCWFCAEPLFVLSVEAAYVFGMEWTDVVALRMSRLCELDAMLCRSRRNRRHIRSSRTRSRRYLALDTIRTEEGKDEIRAKKSVSVLLVGGR